MTRRRTRATIACSIALCVLFASACSDGGASDAEVDGSTPTAIGASAPAPDDEFDGWVAEAVADRNATISIPTETLGPDATLAESDGFVAQVIEELVAANPEFTPLLDDLDDIRTAERDAIGSILPQLAAPLTGGPGESVGMGAPPVIREIATTANPSGINRADLGRNMAELLAIVDLMGKDLKDVFNVGATGSQGDTTLDMQLQVGGPPGSAKEFSFKVKVERDGVTLEAKVAGKVKGDPCPDEAGEVHAEFSYSVTASGSVGGRTVGMQTEVKGTATGYVDDSANLTAFDVDSTTGDAAQHADGRNTFVELHLSGRAEGDFGPGGNARRVDPTKPLDVTRHSRDATQADATSAAEVADSAYGFVATTFAVWQFQWRSGSCVRVVVEAPGRVDVGAHVSIEAKLIHRDGQELSLPIEVTLAGPSSVDPERIDEAPGAVTYVAADEPDQTGTITWRSASRRGIGTLDTAISTKVKLAYRVQGGADDLVVDDVACDVTVPFSLEGSGVTQQFVPTDDTSGSYTYTGNIAGFTLSGEGTYTISFPNGPDQAGSLTASGPGSVETQAGTFSNTGSERYTLTPFEPSETECPPD